MQPFFADAPTLETERLKLRAWRVTDFTIFAAMYQDPEEAKFLGGVVPRGEAWRKFMFHTGHWALLGYGWWVVADKGTDTYVGTVGFADFKRDMVPPYPEGIPEIGWAFLSTVHRRGYATESVKRALEWHDQTIKFPTLGCIVNPDNQPSLKLAAKFGFHVVGESVFRDKTMLRLDRKFEANAGN